MSNGEEERPIKRPAMVDWYSPSQLARTGAQTLLSTLLGSMIDTRRILQAESGEAIEVDYSDRDEFRLDYMADTGDGWNSTFSMAYLLMRPYLEVAGERLERADAVILGGDEVYPAASRKAYYERLLSPVREAASALRLEREEFKRLPRTDLYMVPGNHDWYDSLGFLSRRFFGYRDGDSIQSREFGQFRTKQLRSYFALKLPHHWHVWALDIQLGQEIDNQQYVFFRNCANGIGSDDKIVLCSAEPSIVNGHEVGERLEFNINRVTRLAFDKGARVMVQLAGDTHNYQRYRIATETKVVDGGGRVEYPREHIVSGGGGAFLHPSHAFPKWKERSIEPLKLYPPPSASIGLSYRVLAFAFSHKSMSALIGALYLFLFWGTGLGFQPLLFPIEHPSRFVLAAILLVGCIAFAGFDSAKTIAWGALHGAAHVALAYLCWSWAGRLAAALFGGPFDSVLLQSYVPPAAVFLSGAILGGTLFGVYLWLSLNILRLHHNEAFSALAWPHHKNFLRCVFDRQGNLTIHAVGVQRTASEKNPHPVETHLIEKVVIPSDAHPSPSAPTPEVLR